jgi:selenocysteine-specific elongation factor
MSDSTKRSPQIVVGTAGHIDHGKTSLVRALTGTDTDRLAEEKRRGISIDLGFAHLELANGKSVSFVDVPGHERFIRNMLAGAAGIGAVVLVVAADESVMPQTREHFEICRLLGIRYGFIVLTKVDIAAPEQLKRARRDVMSLRAGSFLDATPIVEASAVSGYGLEEVKLQLGRLSEVVPRQEQNGLSRLPIDRSFTLTGFGTVVTGTLASGRFAVGETVRVHPGGRQLRIRGIQVHNSTVTEAWAGQRAAINLANVESAELRRGDTLTHVNELQGTVLVDVAIDWLPGDKAQPKKQQVLFHSGTSEIVAGLKMFSARLGRLTLATPALVLPGDRFILRRPSPAQTIGGGTILDSFPQIRLNRAKTIARMHTLELADATERIRLLVEESADGIPIAQLVRATGLEPARIEHLLKTDADLLLHAPSGRAFSKRWLGAKRAALVEWLRTFHASNPSAAGAPVAAARMGLAADIAAVVMEGFPDVRVQGEHVSLAIHQAVFSDVESHALSKIEKLFRDAGYQPPQVDEVLRAAVPDPRKGRALLELLLKNKRLVRVAEGLIFHADVIQHVRKSLSIHKGRRFTVPEFKEWTQMSRKYAIPVLEYLDREKVTRRDGDERVIV